MLMFRLFGVATACGGCNSYYVFSFSWLEAHFLATIMLIFEVPLMRISFLFSFFSAIWAKMYFKTWEADWTPTPTPPPIDFYEAKVKFVEPAFLANSNNSNNYLKASQAGIHVDHFWAFRPGNSAKKKKEMCVH